MNHPDSAERQQLCAAKNITLDGEPARISGWRLPFARLARLDGRGGTVEFAWETTARIVANGGHFTS